MRLRRLATLIIAALLSGCGGAAPSVQQTRSGPSEDRFVEVYVALRRAERETSDPAAFEARRREVLEAHGTTAQELIEFAERRAHDPTYIASLWERIEARLAEVAADTI